MEFVLCSAVQFNHGYSWFYSLYRKPFYDEKQIDLASFVDKMHRIGAIVVLNYLYRKGGNRKWI